MSRLTISLPEELETQLRLEARHQGESLSHVVRDALERYLGDTERKEDLPFVALGRSGHRHTARDAERILAEGFGRDRDR